MGLRRFLGNMLTYSVDPDELKLDMGATIWCKLTTIACWVWARPGVSPQLAWVGWNEWCVHPR